LLQEKSFKIPLSQRYAAGGRLFQVAFRRMGEQGG